MDEIMQERICACALNRIFGYEPKYALGFVQNLGSARAVFSLRESEVDGLLGPCSKYKGRVNAGALEEAEKELERLRERGLGFLAITEDDYPLALKEVDDPPVGLYVRSSSPFPELFGKRPAIAIVGTRDISPYGKEMCPAIVSALARAPMQPSIVSGMAFGVDIRAHLAALDCGLPTIGVLPGGIDEVYPGVHGPAAAKIAAAPGSGLVTDYPPGTRPQAFTFLRRNRLIAGLCRATILVESKARGGGMITCRLAQGYGREVFALPGRIDDLRSEGCNILIREKLAEAISSLDGLGRQLGLGQYTSGKKADFAERLDRLYRGHPQKASLTGLALLIRRRRGITLDELCRVSGRSYRQVAGTAGTLEADGIIDIDLLQRCTINAKNV